MDVLPTVLDLAGIAHPGKQFRNREVAPVRGKSWRTLLEASSDQDVTLYNAENDVVGWEQFGIAAVRVGHWKALYLPPPRGPGRWELYDLAKDQGEVHDLAESHRDKLLEMIAHYETYFQESGLFDTYTVVQATLKSRGEKRWW